MNLVASYYRTQASDDCEFLFYGVFWEMFSFAKEQINLRCLRWKSAVGDNISRSDQVAIHTIHMSQGINGGIAE